MSIVLFDNTGRKELYPLTNTVAVAALRTGILTTKQRWAILSGNDVYIQTEAYLQNLYGPVPPGIHYWIDASVIATPDLAQRVLALEENEAISDSNGMIAGKKNMEKSVLPAKEIAAAFKKITTWQDVLRIEHAWDIFQHNDYVLRNDYELLTTNKQSRPLPQNGWYINPENIFVEEGAVISCAIINASAGPVYIGKNSVVMEGAAIRGPFAMCNDAVVKMGAKIYGATTLGPCCVAGGEIKNAVMQGYSNKAHDGYLGDAVIGNWCNLGAGTTNSNVKNTGNMVKMWSTVAGAYIEAAFKCGAVIGDYTRTAINTAINTGSVIGTCCNIFGEGLLPKYIPDFQWGAKGITRYELEKSLKDIDNWKKMKGRSLTGAEKQVLQYIFETT